MEKPMKDKNPRSHSLSFRHVHEYDWKNCRVSTQSVMRWINMFYEKFAANDESQSNIEEIEVDEMVSYITKKKDYIWIWKAIDHNTRKFIGWQCGDRSSKTLTEFFDRLNLWRAKRVYSDFYVCYAEVVGSQRLQQGNKIPSNRQIMPCSATGLGDSDAGAKLLLVPWIC